MSSITINITRLDRAKSSLSSGGLRNVDNYKLISSLLDRFEEEMGLDSNHVHHGVPINIPPPRPMLKHSGKLFCIQWQHKIIYIKYIGIYTGHNENSDGEEMFVCERETFYELMNELNKPCTCRCLSRNIVSKTQVGLLLNL